MRIPQIANNANEFAYNFCSICIFTPLNITSIFFTKIVISIKLIPIYKIDKNYLTGQVCSIRIMLFYN